MMVGDRIRRATGFEARTPTRRHPALGRAAPSDDEILLLRAAIARPEHAEAAWMTWRARSDLDSADGRAAELFPSIAASLGPTALGADEPRLRGLRYRTWVKNELTLESLAMALDAVQPVVSPPLVFKGARVVSEVVERHGVRPMADADLLIDSDVHAAAVDLLRRAGWTTTANWVHATDMADPAGRRLDVHRWILFPRYTRTPSTAWSARSRRADIDGRPVRFLDPADELVLAIVHGVMSSGHSNVRWPLDAEALLAADGVPGPPDWDLVVRSAGEIGVGPIVAAACSFLTDDLGLAIPPAAVEQLDRLPMDRLLRYQWARRRSGRFPTARVRHYVDLQRAAGRTPTLHGYVSQRYEAFREHGPSLVVRNRVRNLRRRVARPPG